MKLNTERECISPLQVNDAFSNDSRTLRQGLAPLVKRKSLSNATPYLALKTSLCALSPASVLSVKQTALLLIGPSKSRVAGLKILGDTVPYHPELDAFNNGCDGVPARSRIRERMFFASASLFSSFCRIKCVRRNEQSELRRANSFATSAVVFGIRDDEF